MGRKGVTQEQVFKPADELLGEMVRCLDPIVTAMGKKWS